ncbi:dTDP-4-dehydrorhamnose 3,5-epimerase [Franconibacter pulveris]|uniref:dTDP-4-dehydrorhamnose 3,5-epimerase n=1 Tax=Franconibacter pulveris TaxID=435910 RepID=UPI0008FF0C9E|nr:dTDP-4-dehydrorhamnose 3,5-epimerase [Franconibacter pulveris]
MNVIETTLPDVLILEPKVFSDERGFFFESFNHKKFEDAIGYKTEFVQDNHSKSAKGVLRGLHYQMENPQGKLLRVIKGAVYDVAVDLRRASPTFKHWFGIELSADNKKQLWIPEGFAHGFYVLEEGTEFVYKCTSYYHPASEKTLLWNDPEINVAWPLHDMEQPILSAKDMKGQLLANSELF